MPHPCSSHSSASCFKHLLITTINPQISGNDDYIKSYLSVSSSRICCGSIILSNGLSSLSTYSIVYYTWSIVNHWHCDPPYGTDSWSKLCLQLKQALSWKMYPPPNRTLPELPSVTCLTRRSRHIHPLMVGHFHAYPYVLIYWLTSLNRRFLKWLIKLISWGFFF